MGELFGKIMMTAVDSQDQAMQLVARLFDVAKPEAVFGTPVSEGSHTVITASEVTVGMGVGFGVGGGTAPEETLGEGEREEEESPTSPAGFGGGGGGGGGSSARPVAAIVIDPDGVRVEPIVDVTKIGLAFFTMLGSVFFMGSKMRQAARGK